MASTSGTGRRPSTTRSASQVLIEIDTPRGSVGQLHSPARPDSAFRAKIRHVCFDKYSNEPQGLDNASNMCYRNAVLAMLITSDLFMQYVVWHVQQLEENDLGGENTHYADPLMELKAISDVYWQGCTPSDLTTAVRRFWKYVKSVEDDPWPRRGSIGDQQDAQEFLSWLFFHVRSALRYENQFETVDRFDQMVQVGHVNRHMCANCGAHNPTKHRIARSPPGDLLMLELKTTSQSNDQRKRSLHTIDQLLQFSVRSVASGYYCPKCDDLWEKQKSNFTDPETRKAAISEKQGKLARQWTNLQTLPEVMFMYIKRFDYKDNRAVKDSTYVEVAEEINVESLLDKTGSVADRQNTRYRLRSVISHSGEAAFGHYRTHVRSTEEGQDTWYCIDDELSEEVDFETINNDQEDWTPYLLCWERIIDDDSAAAPTSVQQPLSSTGKRSSSNPSTSSYGSRPIPSESMRSPRTTSQDSHEGNDNTSSDQVRERGTISEPSHGILRAKVTIAGKIYRFEDLDLTMPPQYHAFARSKKPLKAKVQTKLIASNSLIASNLADPLPRIVAYDLEKARCKQSTEDESRYLTQDSLTKESRKHSRQAAKRARDFPMTYKFVKSPWKEDPSAWLKFDRETINTIVGDGEKAEKAKKAVPASEQQIDGKLNAETKFGYRILAHKLQEGYAKMNNLPPPPPPPSGDDEDVPSYTAPVPTPKSLKHSELRAATERKKTHADATTQRHSKSSSPTLPSLTQFIRKPRTTKSPATAAQPKSTKRKSGPVAVIEPGPAARTRSHDTRARDGAADSDAAKRTTTAPAKGRIAKSAATKVAKATPKVKERATAADSTMAGPMTRKRTRDEADELAGNDRVDVAQPAQKKKRTAAKPAVQKQPLAKAKKTSVTARKPLAKSKKKVSATAKKSTKKTATRKPRKKATKNAHKNTAPQPGTATPRPRRRKSPSPSKQLIKELRQTRS